MEVRRTTDRSETDNR